MKYSIGLDIGTASVGWACIDENFNILKYRERYALGVHEFEEGNTAADRRIKRGARRRYNRRKRRIQLLQEQFSPFFENPKSFFNFVGESTQWRNSNQFEERSLTHVLKLPDIKINPKSYKTIFHLRHDLIRKNQKFDLRLIYLAIHNLVKHRGHFLNGKDEWQTTERTGDIHTKVELLISSYQQINNDKTVIDKQAIKKVTSLLLNKEMIRSEKHQEIMDCLPSTSISELIRLLLNMSTAYVKLFNYSEQVEEYKALKEKGKIQISSEELSYQLDHLLEQERELVLDAISLYQQLLLKELLGSYSYVSEAKVASYELFRKELQQLKSIVNNYGDEAQYRELFITSKANWREYNKTMNINLLSVFDRYIVQAKPNIKIDNMIGNNEEKKDNRNTTLYFNLFVKELITSFVSKAMTDDQREQLELILKKIEERTYMLKQVNTSNSAIPVQNSMLEARKILENQAKYYPQITDAWIEKIIQLISFRIPYFVGPLVKSDTVKTNSEQEKFGWMQRKDNVGRITPWNYEEKVDVMNTSEGFITRMTSNCTYLRGKKVLPKHSLLYQQYELLDELNRIQVRKPSQAKHSGYRLDNELKKWLITELFQKQVKVTHRELIEAILRSANKEDYLDHYDGEQYQVFGTSKEKEFASTQSSYVKLKSIFGEVLREAEDLYEQIIYYITIFNEEYILRLKLEQLQQIHSYGYLITEFHIRAIMGWKITGWGKLSRELLQEIPVYENSDKTVIEVMLNESKVFNELLSTKVSRLEQRISGINKQDLNQKESFNKIKYTEIASLAGSPAIKRGIWKAIKLVEELVGIFGEPAHIMIEVAREEGSKGKRTKSREEQWKKIGKEIKSGEYAHFFKENSKHESKKFMNVRLWLYLLQGGKCLYSQEPLVIESLSNYQIDHIIPRRLIKDDSIDNLALVKGDKNQAKAGDMLPLEIISTEKHFSIKAYWKQLFELNMMSRKKYDNLMKTSLSEIEISQFIQRQLVETRQIIKHVQQLLLERYVNSEVHLVKANIISNFRKANELPKIRELNNKHHAVDAFLNVAFIQSIIKKYGINFFDFSIKRQGLDSKLAERVRDDKEFFLFRNFNEQKFPGILADQDAQSAREYLDEVLYDVPWQSTYATGSSESSFYNETVYSPKLHESPLNKRVHLSKVELTHKGFNNLFSYIVNYDEVKKKNVITKQVIIDVRVFDWYKYRQLSDQELVEKLMLDKYPQATNITYILKLHKYQKLLYNGQPALYISSGELRNGKQLSVDRGLYGNIARLLAPTYFKKITKKEEQRLISTEPMEYTDTFQSLTHAILKQHNFLPGVSDSKKFDKILNSLTDKESVTKAVKEALKVSSVSGERSDALGGRWQVSLKPELVRPQFESITGLKYRK